MAPHGRYPVAKSTQWCLRAVLLLTAAALAACSDSPAASPTSVTAGSVTPVESTAAPTAVIAPTVVAPTGTVPPATPTAPPLRRTGIDALDRVAAAVVAADRAFIEAALEYVLVGCTGETDPIPGPGCPRGVDVGTVIEAFPRASCEFTFEAATESGPIVDGIAVPGLVLVAAYRIAPPSGVQSVPAGDYGLVFVGSQSKAVAVAVSVDGGIVSSSSTCNRADLDSFLAELPIEAYILPPAE